MVVGLAAKRKRPRGSAASAVGTSVLKDNGEPETGVRVPLLARLNSLIPPAPVRVGFTVADVCTAFGTKTNVELCDGEGVGVGDGEGEGAGDGEGDGEGVGLGDPAVGGGLVLLVTPPHATINTTEASRSTESSIPRIVICGIVAPFCRERLLLKRCRPTTPGIADQN